jgi:hypothetical protein
VTTGPPAGRTATANSLATAPEGLAEGATEDARSLPSGSGPEAERSLGPALRVVGEARYEERENGENHAHGDDSYDHHDETP